MMQSNFEFAATQDDLNVLDVTHLMQQTQGDRDLAKQLLRLFTQQADQLINQMRPEIGLSGPAGRKNLADLAHRLRGSALAIGAKSIAQAAQTLETQARLAEGDVSFKLETLKNRVAQTQPILIQLLTQWH